jgi:hypothetical protein
MTLPFVDEIVDQLEDVGFEVEVMYPYVIVSLKNRKIDPMDVAVALDIDPALCVRNLNGNIRITCD